MRDWSVAALRQLDAWTVDDYPLWHDQMKMSGKIRHHARPGKLLVRGEGCWVEDVAGRRYLDARSGICNVQLGYDRADIVDAMHKQATELPFACAIRYSRPALTTLRYAAALVEAAPASLTRLRLNHMGSAAVETALQAARLYWRNLGYADRTSIVALEDSFHGSSLMTLAASGEPFISDLLVLPPEGFVRAPRPTLGDCPGCTEGAASGPWCTAHLESAIQQIGAERIAAFIVEPVMFNRVYPLSAHYLSELRAMADRHGFLLIFDEVSIGFGRLGSLFAADHFGVEPDMLCMAKGMTSGYAPLGGVLVNERVFGAFDLPGRPHFASGSSADGHPVSCAAALATLDALRDGKVFANVRRQERRVLSGLRDALSGNPLVAQVRGLGLITAVELRTADGREAPLALTRRIEAACDERGVLVQHAHNNIVLYPPLVITDDEVDIMVGTVSEVIDETTRAGGG